jgi:hypothetical protein
MVCLSVGSGAMELERQLIEKLAKSGFKDKIFFLGIDKANDPLKMVKENFSELIKRGIVGVDLRSGGDIFKKRSEQFQIVLLKKSFFDLKKNNFGGKIFVAYHSRLKHHLTVSERVKLDKILVGLSPRVAEMDDFFNIPSFIFPSIITWRWPETLNGALFSYLRDPSPGELDRLRGDGWKVKKYNLLGYYLRKREYGASG